MAQVSLFEVDIAKLKNDIINMKNLIQAINSDRDKMITELQSLSTKWKGSASDYFKKQYESDEAQFSEIINAINGVIAEFDQAAKDYTQCEKDVESEIRQIKIGR